jgi:ring-1,2-phenylacetyl-CoA epoxidase subunit PaaD
MLTTAQAWDILGRVPDPEIPAISVTELGIVRDVQAAEEGVDVVVTPTYSGCPATEAIERSIREALSAAGARTVRVRQRLSPAWSTDWIAEDARERLRAYGIAPPGERPARGEQPLSFVPHVSCPRCDSADTERLSQFGSTACKALYRCRACREPFEYFKPL